MKKNNYRRCLISKQSLHKDKLYRFVFINDEFIFDKYKELNGRGYYFSIELNQEDIKKFIAKRFKKEIKM